ncbi:hypothetical protein BDV96DRAFT_639612 [Lophiotrema nucula]|uniref:Uncharacterized protein n=1 Tax=Lophiotrema nucula TaxID=690887 RepID=A0A6A5ZVR9_9PLEO|nr:hypothetical protein BDV96DRAFT_639612 [Lophiotrema nucula]
MAANNLIPEELFLLQQRADRNVAEVAQMQRQVQRTKGHSVHALVKSHQQKQHVKDKQSAIEAQQHTIDTQQHTIKAQQTTIDEQSKAMGDLQQQLDAMKLELGQEKATSRALRQTIAGFKGGSGGVPSTETSEVEHGPMSKKRKIGAESVTTAEDGTDDSPLRVVKCQRCFLYNKPCDRGRPCAICKLRGLNCVTSACRHKYRRVCGNAGCTFAHEEDEVPGVEFKRGSGPLAWSKPVM